jgi:two-component system CheB/CheR fusion protein
MPEHGLRVLVVDDCRDTTDTLAILLRLWGHEVAVAHDGPAALDTAQTRQPQVVLLDLGLPRMDGCEAARRLRRLPGLEGVCLVAMTGYGQDQDRQRTRAAGFDFHLLKPFDADALAQLLATLHQGGHVACHA